MYKYFEDKVVWITGASSGIGKALAIQLIQHSSAKLVLSARQRDALENVAAISLDSNRIMILDFDLSTPFDAQELTQKVIQHFGRIDMLINNGGISQRATVLETSESIERMLFEINYFSYIKLSRAVLPYMVQQKSGHIVIMSSIAGKFGFYLRSTYSAAKHALHGYFETLRLEYEKYGIAVSIICPGKVKTNVSIHAIDGSGHPHGKMDESHQHAMSAQKAADIILRAISQKKKEVYVGGKEILMVYFKRYCPLLFEWLIRKQSPY